MSQSRAKRLFTLLDVSELSKISASKERCMGFHVRQATGKWQPP